MPSFNHPSSNEFSRMTQSRLENQQNIPYNVSSHHQFAETLYGIQTPHDRMPINPVSREYEPDPSRREVPTQRSRPGMVRPDYMPINPVSREYEPDPFRREVPTQRSRSTLLPGESAYPTRQNDTRRHARIFDSREISGNDRNLLRQLDEIRQENPTEYATRRRAELQVAHSSELDSLHNRHQLDQIENPPHLLTNRALAQQKGQFQREREQLAERHAIERQALEEEIREPVPPYPRFSQDSAPSYRTHESLNN